MGGPSHQRPIPPTMHEPRIHHTQKTRKHSPAHAEGIQFRPTVSNKGRERTSQAEGVQLRSDAINSGRVRLVQAEPFGSGQLHPAQAECVQFRHGSSNSDRQRAVQAERVQFSSDVFSSSRLKLVQADSAHPVGARPWSPDRLDRP